MCGAALPFKEPVDGVGDLRLVPRAFGVVSDFFAGFITGALPFPLFLGLEAGLVLGGAGGNCSAPNSIVGCNVPDGNPPSPGAIRWKE